MLCNVIKVPSNFSLTIGWMGLWWTAIRMLFLFCIHSWLTLLKSAVKTVAPFLHYIYGRFIATDRNDDIDLLLDKLKKLLSIAMFFLCVDAIFQMILIYASNKRSYMWMLPWMVYSFMSLIILTILPLDYYTHVPVDKTQTPNADNDNGVMHTVEKMSSYFIYLSIQMILLIIVFENFQKLRVNKSYRYLKQALEKENEMITGMLRFYEKSVLNRYSTQIKNKRNGQPINLPNNSRNPSEKEKATNDLKMDTIIA